MSVDTLLYGDGAGEGAGSPKPPGGGKPDVRVMFWIFVVFYALMGAGVCLLARVTPPPRPDVGPAQALAWYDQHALTIRIGLVVLLMIAGGAAISNGLIGYHMKRMTSGSALAYGYIGAMAVGAIPGFQLVMLCFLLAIFRPQRDPELVWMFYDLGMLSYNGSLGCFTAAYFALAAAIFYDKNQIFPKWFAYVTIWQIVTEVIASQMWLFESGAFAWNGIISFFIAVAIFSAWLGFLILILRVAGRREPIDSPPVD